MLAPAALGAWAAAYVVGALPISAAAEVAPVLLGGCALGAVLALAALIRWRRGLLAIGVIALAAAGLAATAAVVRAPVLHPSAVTSAVESAALVTATVTVESGAHAVRAAGASWGGETVWFDATLRTLDGASGLAAPVRVFAPAATARLPIGAEAEVTGRIRDSEVTVASTALLQASEEPRVMRDAPPLAAAADALRLGFLDRSAAIEGDAGGLLPGLAIGDTSRLDPSLEQAMRTASLTHLTAVSGANCAVVVAAAFLLAALFGAGVWLRTLVALAALAGFVLLVTPEPSVVRAAVMATVVLLARLLDRDGAPAAALWLAVIVLVVADPPIATRLGFVLSVLATAGLLLLAEPIADRLAGVMPRPLALALAVPTAAQLACQPAIVLIDPSLPLYGVVANLLAEPAAPIATGVGLIGCLVVPVWPAAADVAIAVAAVPAWWIASIARAAESWPSPRIPWLPGLPGVLLLSALTLAVLLLLTRSPRWRLPRRVGAGALVLSLVVGGATAVATPILRAGSVPPDWRIAACDVGQGDAVLWREAGAVALVDVGPDPAPLRDCLGRLGVRRIDLLVLSHYDLDHVGGIDAVLGSVDAVLVGPPARAGDHALLDRLTASGASVRRAERGEHGMLDSARWRIDWPESSSNRTSNAASLVLRIDAAPDAIGGAMSAVFLGDLGAEEQGRVSRLTEVGPVDVVKVAHHGSGDQSPALYDVLHASVGLISVGADNDYGHPAPKTVRMLQDRGTTVERTDQQGLVVVAARPEGLSVWSERDAVVLTAANGGSDGRQGTRAGRGEDVGEGRDPAIELESGAAGAGRADHRSGEIPRRADDAVPARFPPRGGPEPRGQRHLGRRVRAGGVDHAREPVALRRAAADPRRQRGEGHRRLPGRGARLPGASRRQHNARAPPRRWSARQEVAGRDPRRSRRRCGDRLRRAQARERQSRLRGRGVPGGRQEGRDGSRAGAGRGVRRRPG
ncbi:ComEC/Rec2 family competence protein [Microbacteriaceae bacterium VKM Ac-2854]|nr:ComEC/Rec2 family competence protein [Microbacteriaceae bacterium VKM Ac-2854]